MKLGANLRRGVVTLVAVACTTAALPGVAAHAAPTSPTGPTVILDASAPTSPNGLTVISGASAPAPDLAGRPGKMTRVAGPNSATSTAKTANGDVTAQWYCNYWNYYPFLTRLGDGKWYVTIAGYGECDTEMYSISSDSYLYKKRTDGTYGLKAGPLHDGKFFTYRDDFLAYVGPCLNGNVREWSIATDHHFQDYNFYRSDVRNVAAQKLGCGF